MARKIAATFASTGTPSHFLSPADAVHGDLGSIRKGDVVLIFSASGESDEILRLLSIVKKLDHPVIAITATRNEQARVGARMWCWRWGRSKKPARSGWRPAPRRPRCSRWAMRWR